MIAARGWRITVTTAACQLILWLVLLACLRGVGLSQAQVPWQTSLAAFAFVRLLTALPITPGGLGITELGLIGILAAGVGPGASAQVTAAVLLYRATYSAPIPSRGAAPPTSHLAASHPHCCERPGNHSRAAATRSPLSNSPLGNGPWVTAQAGPGVRCHRYCGRGVSDPALRRASRTISVPRMHGTASVTRAATTTAGPTRIMACSLR